MSTLLSRTRKILNAEIPNTPAIPFKAETWELLNKPIPNTYEFTDRQRKVIFTVARYSLVFSAASFASFASPAFAVDFVLADEINKVGGIADMLEGMVSSMTNVLAGSGGASAAFQVFRRVILNNL